MDDFVLMKDFCDFYKKCFGDPFKENWMYKNLVMLTVMRFWLKNKEIFDEKTMIECFKRIQDSGAIELESHGVDLATQENLAYKIGRVINRGRSKNVFKKFWVKEKGEEEQEEE